MDIVAFYTLAALAGVTVATFLVLALRRRR